MAIAYWQNDNFVIFLSPENQSLASKVGGIKSPEIMSLCLLVNFCHFVWPFALTGCSLAPDYQRPAMPVPQQFSLSQNGLVNAADNYQNAGWRTFLLIIR